MRNALAALLLVLAASAASAAPNAWTGGAVGDWNVGANWSLGTVPGPLDDATIGGQFVIAYATASAPSVGTLTIGAGGVLDTFTGLTAIATVTLQTGAALQFGATAPFTAGTFALAAGSSATYNAPPVSAGTVPALHLQVGIFTLSAGSTLTVAGGGYAAGGFSASGAGPGGSAGGAGGGGTGGGGGGAAGAGGAGGSAANGGAAFGAMPPSDGGAGGGGGSSAAGGAGGGWLIIDANTAALDGLLAADGAPGGSFGAEGGGGGAGGSVIVRAQVLTGAGTVSVRGGDGGSGGTAGGGGGGGGRAWLRESGSFAVMNATLTVVGSGGNLGGGASFGSGGAPGAAFVDPRNWTGLGPDSLASDAANWSEGLAPSGGERLVFGSSATLQTCDWDLAGVSAGSVTVTAAFSTTVVLAVPMNVLWKFSMAGGTFTTAAPGLSLTIGGWVAQTGGRLDLLGSGLALAASTSPVPAGFYDARASSLTVGGVVPTTVTVSGLLEIANQAQLSAAATLAYSSGTLSFDGDFPFSGAGSVNFSSVAVVAAVGVASQTWTAWPGTLGVLRVSNASSGGLLLSLAGGSRFVLAGGVSVDTGDVITATSARVDVGGDWANYGAAFLAGSTVSFRAVSGVQRVLAGGTFDNLVVNDAGAQLMLSTYVVVADSVGVLSGTFNLEASTLEVRGSWTEVPGATVLGGTSVTIFDGPAAQRLYQLSGNSFGAFHSSSAAGVTISSSFAAASVFQWDTGPLAFPGAALSLGGDMLAAGGAGIASAGSTVTFVGASTQTVTIGSLANFVDANFSAAGVRLGANASVASFRVLPGAVFDGQNESLVAAGPVWDTSFSTYYAVNSVHTVTWAPASSITIASGSVVNAKLALTNGKTAVLLGDLNIEGSGNTFDPRLGSMIVNAPGGSTIAFRGSSDLVPSSGANWFYAGDAADSWLVFEGTGAARGAAISTNTYGTVRVTLNTSTDVFKLPNMNLTGRFIVEGGTVRPGSAVTLAVGGDVLQTGGLIDFETISTGTLLMTGPSTQTVKMLAGAHALWNVTDASTATVTAASDLTIRGNFVVTGGTFAAGAGNLGVQGRVYVSSAGAFAGQSSTFTLNGAVAGVTAQSLAVYGAAAFNGLAANVQTASLLTSATAAVFTDAFAGGTLAVEPGAQLTVADLRLGAGAGANLLAQSIVPGSPWYLKVAAVSSATAVTPSDSNASPGLAILANDGRSVDGGGNVNWDFYPQLLVLLPGETFTPGVAPGKTGAPSFSTAGVSVPVSVRAVSARFDPASSATGTVTLSGDDPFGTYGAPQALVSGAAAMSFTPLIAEPSPRATHVTASTFFAAGVSTAAVIPAGLSRLQIVLPGESPVPGSPAGRAGAPFPRVKGIAFTATVRATDQYWNLIATVTDSFAFTTSGSTSNLAAPAPLSAGQEVAGGLILYSTGAFTLSATDATEPAVLAATSSVFSVAPPSVSSPTAAFYVPNGAAVATLGGAIAGTASDGSSISRVRVDVLEVETGFHYDSSLLRFTALAPVYTTTTLAAPLAASTSWSNPVPDAALTSGRHYAATALVDDPTGFTDVASSTFDFDQSSLSFGSRNGQGTAAVAPASAPGCETLVATVTFVAGSAGVSAGGAVAVRVPDGWTTPAGVTTAYPPPAGFWNVTSTSLAATLGSTVAVVAPASYGGQTLGAGWLLLKVATNSARGYLPGEKITLTYAGLPPLSPLGRGAQTFSAWSQADGNGALAPLAVQPAVTLTAGTTSALAFADATPLSLGPLQASPTVQLKIVDMCGNDKPGASSGTATVSLAVPFGGGYLTDSTALFYTAAGSTVSAVFMTTGTALSPGFTVVISTVGPALAYIQATASFTAVSGPAFTTAMRAVRLTASSEAFTGASVDTGTLTPGATTAALSAGTPDAYPGRLVFTLADPALSWTAVLSLDGVNFATPTFTASGTGNPAGPIVLTWDGVDRVSSPPRFAPPGHYHARLKAGGGGALNTALEIVVPQTAGYAGRLGAAGAGAFARAVGPGAGDGAFAQASATGYFLLTGLHAGQSYQLSVATAATAGLLPVTLSTALAAPPAAAPSTDLGTVSLPAPTLLSVAAVLPVPAPFDEVGGFIGRAADGSTAFSGALHFSSGAASSDDGGPLFSRAASTWSVVLAAPGTYSVELDLPDLRLSTVIAGVALGAGGTNLLVPFSKSANVFGWAVLASTVAGGTTVSVQATKAGASAAAAFGAVFVSSVPSVVSPSSGAYALYGLDPGTWTVLASAPGFVSSAATIVVLSSADVPGPTLTLGYGGTIVGTVTVSGDSTGATQCFAGAGGAPGACAPGTFNVAVQATAVGGPATAAAGATLTVSALSSTGTFVLSGLAPGLWNLRASLPGFALQPAGGLTVAVAGASVSTAALTLAPLDARLSVTVLLPPLGGGACRAPAAWKTLGLAFDGSDGASRTFGDATALSGPGSFETLNCSSATFFTPALPPGPVRAAALVASGGQWAYGRALLAAGTTASLTLDLTVSSAAATGSLSVSGQLSIATATAAGAPYTVSASSAAGILSAAPGVSFCLLGSRDPVARPALRAELVPYDPLLGTPPLRRAYGGAGSCAAPGTSTAAATSLGFAAAINADGTFAFAPGVAPGTYLLRVPGELDDDPADGAEALEFDQLVTVGSGGIVLTPRLGRGSTVSGTLTAPANLTPGRSFRVSLVGAGGVEASGANVAPPAGGAAAFALNGVPDGAYSLAATDLGSPRAFAAAPVAIAVAGANVSGRALALVPSGTIFARLSAVQAFPDGSRQAVLVTGANAGLLPPGFAATATADPAGPGGPYVSRPAADGSVVDASGRLSLDGLPPGTYDVTFAAPAGAVPLAAGALASGRAAGVSVAAGQAVDLGVVTLFSGSVVSGQVTDATSGLPVSGLTVSARPSSSAGAAPGAAADPSATTDASGRYFLGGLDPTQRWYDVTAAPRGAAASGRPLPPYAGRRTLTVDVSSGATVNFSLAPANGTVSGRVASFNGQALTASLGPGLPAAPGAAVYLQTAGVPPAEDPLADLAFQTNPDGTFAIPAIAAGSYVLTASALGQGGAVRAVVASSSSTSVGVVTLSAGGTLTGAVRLPDGTAPSASEVRAIAAVAPDSSAFLYAALTTDPTGSLVTGYAVGGMAPGKTYRLIVSGPSGLAYVPPEGAAVVLASSADARAIDLTLRPPSGPVSFRATRSGTQWALTALFPRPLRAQFASDSDPTRLLSTAAAAGALSGAALGADRQTLTALYAPGLGETTAVFLASGALAATDWSSTSPGAAQLTASATAALQLSGDGLSRATVANGIGGALTFDGDAGRVVLPRGAFNVDAATMVAVSFARSGAASAFGALAPPASAASALYDVSLPGGVPTGLAHPAQLSLAYSTAVANPSGLNLYWYNPAAQAYVLQPDVLGGAPVVDPAARTVTVRVNHFSTYVLLNSAAGAIGGSPFAGGSLDAHNFPNPFDLSVKTVTTIHGGGSPSIRGTMVSVFVPAGLSGEGRLRIFDITGRLLRTIDMGAFAGGQTYYQNWDGRTDFGRDVASGLYLAEVDVGSQRKIFKMAVLK